MTGIEQAIYNVGGQSALARLIGCSQQNVGFWLKQGYCPAERVIEVEQATLTFALPRLLAGDDVTRRALTTAIDKLEHNVRLLRLNLNEAAALEDFLLASLRIWSRRS